MKSPGYACLWLGHCVIINPENKSLVRPARSRGRLAPSTYSNGMRPAIIPRPIILHGPVNFADDSLWSWDACKYSLSLSLSLSEGPVEQWSSSTCAAMQLCQNRRLWFSKRRFKRRVFFYNNDSKEEVRKAVQWHGLKLQSRWGRNLEHGVVTHLRMTSKVHVQHRTCLKYNVKNQTTTLNFSYNKHFWETIYGENKQRGLNYGKINKIFET